METGKNAKKSGKAVIFAVLAALAVLVLAFLFITGRFPPKGSSTGAGSSTISDETVGKPQQDEVSSIAQPEPSESDEVRFGNKLDPFQGEWKSTKSDNIRLVISGDEVNSIFYDDFETGVVKDIYTFYFGFDENGELVVLNQHKQPRQTIEVNENGQLLRQNIPPDDKTETYEKASDSTNIPEKTLEPAIGMSELEIIASTWGPPKDKNKTTTANGESEQWVYEDGYIYFENGKVTAIQEK